VAGMSESQAKVPQFGMYDGMVTNVSEFADESKRDKFKWLQGPSQIK
jgi:hypothetical protein